MLCKLRRARRRGSSAVILVLCFMVTMAFVALGVDWGAVASTRAEMQIAADAAAMSGASALPIEVDAKSRAIAYGQMVSIRGEGLILNEDDIEVGDWDQATGSFTPGAADDSDAVRVTVRYTLDLPISALFGFPSVDLVAVSGGGASITGKVPDLVIVQDVTTSFRDEIDQAREADIALIECINDKADPASKLGIVAFSGLELNLFSPTELLTYETGYSQMISVANTIKICGNTGMPACTNTNIAFGLHMANAILTRSTSDEDIGRAALLVSDGEPTYSGQSCLKVGGKYKTAAATKWCPIWKNTPTNARLKAAALTERDLFESAGYDLYTAFYNEDDDPVQSAFMEDLAANDGVFLESPSPDEIGDMLQAICHVYTNSKAGLLF